MVGKVGGPHEKTDGPKVRLGLIVLVGLVLRAWNLGGPILWHDEVYTRIFVAGHQSQDWKSALYTGDPVTVSEVQAFQHYNHHRSLGDTIRGLAIDEPQHPPAYYLLARGWVSLGATLSDTLANQVTYQRLFSVIWGVLTIPAMFWLALELGLGVSGALSAAALLSVSPFFVLYAREIREYALWGLLLTLSTASLLRALKNPRFWPHYVLCTTLSLYTSFSTASLLLAHLLFLLLASRFSRPFAHATLAWTGILALFSPWLVLLARNYEAFTISMAWSREIVIPRWELLTLLSQNASQILLPVWVPGISIAAVGALAWSQKKHGGQVLFLGLAMIAAPLLLLVVPDLIWGGIRSISARYLTVSYLGVLIGLATLAQGGRLARTTLGVLLGAGLVASMLATRENAPVTKGISRGLVGVAQAIAQEEPGGVVIGNQEQHHPGNLLALAELLPEGMAMVLVPIGGEVQVPEGGGPVFLYSPLMQDRIAIEGRLQKPSELLYEDTYISLYVIRR